MISLDLRFFGKIGAILCLISCLTAPVYAQFIDLNLDVNSKLTASTEQMLDFGTLVTNSGRKSIEFSSLKMGIFSITALENEVLLINLEKPDKLQNENPSIKDRIPLNLLSRYGYSSRNYQETYDLSEATSIIKVKEDPEPGPWNTVYIFIYGSINIGNVPDGVYSNEVVLDVEYL